MITRLSLCVLLLAVGFGRLSAAVTVWFTACPSTVPSGQQYYVEAASQPWDFGYGCDVAVYKNSTWFAYGQAYPEYYPTIAYAGASTTDYGAQTVEYFADGLEFVTADYGYAYAWVTITAS